MEKASLRADCSILRGYLLPVRLIGALTCLLLAGCVRPAVQSAPSAVIPCQFSPAETWRWQPCTGDCTHGPTPETPPAVRDSAAVTARLARLRTSSRGKSGWSEQIHLRVLIHEDASVKGVSLRQSSGDAWVDGVASNHVRRLRFVPRRIGQRYVSSHVDLVLAPAPPSAPALTCTLVSSRDRT
jgi:hypothetical protein